eukprot:m51a1_g7683 putative wd40 repeat-containing protein (478) ;mRNA; f:20522-22436
MAGRGGYGAYGGGGGGGGGMMSMMGPGGMGNPMDGRRMRKPIQRRTVDYGAPVVHSLQNRVAIRDFRDRELLQPHYAWLRFLPMPAETEENTSMGICTKFAHMSINKQRCAINCLAWTAEGRRLITGAQTGEFTLWNGLTFNFETIFHAHNTAVRTLAWTRGENFLVSGDQSGAVMYWQTSMNNVQSFNAHTEAIRDISFAHSDLKFLTCSDDKSIKVWDFHTCTEERALQGHGWDVKGADWHPTMPLIVSGSKDNFVKLWDAKSGKNIATLQNLHKGTVSRVRWNANGNWFLSCASDQLIKLFDIRAMREMVVFRGHKKEVTALRWHPFLEGMFVSGGYDGSIMYWDVSQGEAIADIPTAHENAVPRSGCIVRDLAWHPLGHIMASCSSDNTTKFWCRNRPGETAQDSYRGKSSAAAAAAAAYEPDVDEGRGMQVDAQPPPLFNYIPGEMATGAIPGMGPMTSPHSSSPPPGFYQQ